MDRRSGDDTGRIEAFSDGVFAIAITLLVIEIGVPHMNDAPLGATLFGELADQWPSYLAYVISFLQIGVIWANHHNRFRYIVRSDHGLLFLNILFLMCVAFIPFPTALLAEYLGETTTESATAGIVYAGSLMVTAFFFTLLWLYVAGSRRLLDQSLDLTIIRAMTRRYVLGMLFYVLAFAISFVSLAASLVLLVVLALLFILPEASERTPKRPSDRSQRRIR
ncbi:MAG: TMEM175 family protein [Actinomycetota bacterium]|nr:TMEM175 family protein [Actinomycetota bacterium]